VHHGKCAATYKLTRLKRPYRLCVLCPIQEASVYTEVDVRRDKKYVHTLVYITMDTFFLVYIFFAAILMPGIRLIGWKMDHLGGVTGSSQADR
jgi:hypothetical protein